MRRRPDCPTWRWSKCCNFQVGFRLRVGFALKKNLWGGGGLMPCVTAQYFLTSKRFRSPLTCQTREAETGVCGAELVVLATLVPRPPQKKSTRMISVKRHKNITPENGSQKRKLEYVLSPHAKSIQPWGGYPHRTDPRPLPHGAGGKQALWPGAWPVQVRTSLLSYDRIPA